MFSKWRAKLCQKSLPKSPHIILSKSEHRVSQYESLKREREKTNKSGKKRKKKYFCLCDKEEESESIKTNQSTWFRKHSLVDLVDLKLEIDQEVVEGLKEKWNNKKCDNLSKYRSKVDHHHHQHHLLEFVYSNLFCASSENVKTIGGQNDSPQWRKSNEKGKKIKELETHPSQYPLSLLLFVSLNFLYSFSHNRKILITHEKAFGSKFFCAHEVNWQRSRRWILQTTAQTWRSRAAAAVVVVVCNLNNNNSTFRINWNSKLCSSQVSFNNLLKQWEKELPLERIRLKWHFSKDLLSRPVASNKSTLFFAMQHIRKCI